MKARTPGWDKVITYPNATSTAETRWYLNQPAWPIWPPCNTGYAGACCASCALATRRAAMAFAARRHTRPPAPHPAPTVAHEPHTLTLADLDRLWERLKELPVWDGPRKPRSRAR